MRHSQFFDYDHDGVISFTDFIRGMSVLLKGSHDEKAMRM